MTEDSVALSQALALFRTDARGTHISTRFFDVACDSEASGESVAFHFKGVMHDLRNIADLADRLEWMRRVTSAGELDTNRWRTFSGLDVEHLFIQTRSLMDHVAAIIRCLVPKGGQLPESFRKLRDQNEKYRERLQCFSDLVTSAVWFDDMRNVRDALVHSGAQPVVFGEPADGLLFQVYAQHTRKLVNHNLCMYNENVLRFDRYVAVLFSNILYFLDQFGNRLPYPPSKYRIGSVRSYGSGYLVLQRWMLEADAEVKRVSNQGA